MNKHTINDSNKWLSYLKDNSELIISEDIRLSEIVTFLETDPDRLDFDINNKDIVEYYMLNDIADKYNDNDSNKCKNIINLSPKHKNYEYLFKFSYIGVKYLGQWLE